MSITRREQMVLDAMEDGLARSSPKLASMLTIFSRLTEGEELPVHEPARELMRALLREPARPAAGDLGTGSAAAGRTGASRTRRYLSRNAWRWLWLVAAVALLALALTVGHGTGKQPCTALRNQACAQARIPPPVRPGTSRPGGL